MVMARLKVYGGLIHSGAAGQLRTIVAATSRAKAAELLGVTVCEMAAYWSETGNKDELAFALSNPGQVYQATSSMGKDFRPVNLKRRM